MEPFFPGARRARGRLIRTLLAVAMSAWTWPADAQAVSTPVAVKAAFLFNFAKFAEWPSDVLSPGQHLCLCVVGDTAMASALEQLFAGRVIDGHGLMVEALDADGPIRTCQLLYIGGLDAKRATQLIAALKDTAVFTVSDADDFAAMGGVAQLILEKDRMRFAINMTAARRARLTLSSRLLSLAQIIKDQPDVTR